MSVSNRKVGLYYFDFIDKNENKLEKDKLIEYFNGLLDFINAKDYEDKIIEISTSNRFYFVESINKDETKRDIVFKSAKIGHRPPLIKKDTGEERENPKLLDEGESEKTHLTIKYKNDEIIVALEERKVGITIGQIVKYLNDFNIQNPIEEHYSINLNIIPYSGFIEHLNDFERITIGKIEMDKQYLGSEYLELADFGNTIQENITVTINANRKNSIIPDNIIKLYDKYKQNDTKVKRIRIQGYTSEKTKIQLDTESLKKIEHIEANIDDLTGLVDTNDLFKKLNIILQEL